MLPSDTGVTTPVLEFIVAIAVFEELHDPPVMEGVNVIVDPTHTAFEPDIVGITHPTFTIWVS